MHPAVFRKSEQTSITSSILQVRSCVFGLRRKVSIKPWILRQCVLCEVQAEAEERVEHHVYITEYHNQMAALQ